MAFGAAVLPCCSITILREGVEQVMEVTATQVKTLVPSMHGFDCLPSYFVVGGLVFVPLTTRFLKDYFGSDWRRRCPESLLHVISRGFQDFKDEQIVVLCHLLISDVNYGYRLYAPAIVRSSLGPSRPLVRTTCCLPFHVEMRPGIFGKLGARCCSRRIVLAAISSFRLVAPAHLCRVRALRPWPCWPPAGN